VLKGVPKGAKITIMIGPEGDFSPEEARQALENGFIPVHLGPSRLRTETAAVTAATAVYLHFIE
jgi:16S rRNA (uracil1498-N3)-methyltransferase